MRQTFISPIIGGLVAIIVIGLWMHNGATSNAASSCHVAMGSSSQPLSPMLVGAMIRRGVHC